jgi:archaemetzincin
MKLVTLIPVGEIARGQIESLARGLTQRLGVACSIRSDGVDPRLAFNPLRGQFHSTEILQLLHRHASFGNWRVLGVTGQDLYIPILTYVFGEAQLNGPCAVVSSHRLRQEFYGMPEDPAIQSERLLKEALHELGHTLGLRHCSDYRCVMSSSNAVENIDLKMAEYCVTCASALVAR